jgi:WD40 repeat protein
VWNPITGACLHLLRDPDYDDTVFQGIAWSPDGQLLASASYMHGVQVWDTHTYTRLWVGYPPPTKIRRVAWSPDSSRLASCGDDGSICLWQATDGTLQKRLEKHLGGVASVAWSPDGTQLVSVGGGRGRGEIVVSDASSGESLYTLPSQADMVFAAVWSLGGEMLISGGSDGSICWWKSQNREWIRTCMGHQGAVQALKISPDGRMLASSGNDDTIRIWNLESGEVLRTLRRDRPYERLSITGISGLTKAQKMTLQALGAVEEGALWP